MFSYVEFIAESQNGLENSEFLSENIFLGCFINLGIKYIDF